MEPFRRLDAVAMPMGTPNVDTDQIIPARFLKWTRDGSAFYIRTNGRDPKFFDVYRVRADDYARTLVYQDDKGYDVGDILDCKFRFDKVENGKFVMLKIA